ncbi:MAG: hypothetical protein AAGJ73_06460 [Pseudomonadota bacterium]
MRKPHRRIHLLIWLALAPATLAAALYALRLAPVDQQTELPVFIEGSG